MWVPFVLRQNTYIRSHPLCKTNKLPHRLLSREIEGLTEREKQVMRCDDVRAAKGPSLVPAWFRADSWTNLIKQGEIVTDRPCGSVAQWSPNVTGEEKAHGPTANGTQNLSHTLRALWPLSYWVTRSTHDIKIMILVQAYSELDLWWAIQEQWSWDWFLPLTQINTKSGNFMTKSNNQTP